MIQMMAQLVPTTEHRYTPTALDAYGLPVVLTGGRAAEAVLDVHGITMCKLGEEPTIATIMIAFGTSQEQALALLSFKNFKKELENLGLPYKLVFNLPDSTNTAVPGQQAACMAMMCAMGLDMAPLQAAASMTVAAEREAAWKQAWAVLCKAQLDQVRHTIRTPNAVVAEEPPVLRTSWTWTPWRSCCGALASWRPPSQ